MYLLDTHIIFEIRKINLKTDSLIAATAIENNLTVM